MNKQTARLITALLVGLCFPAQALFARISILSPWSFQNRMPTQKREIAQTVGLHSGISGVSPAGMETDSKFVNCPYYVTYGLLDIAEVGAGWGLEFLDRKGRGSQFGIRDLNVAARYRFFDPKRSERMPGLDMEFGFSFPTASFNRGLGTGGVGFIFGWGLVLPLDPVRAHFSLGYRVNTENSDDVHVGNVFSYSAGATYPLKGRQIKQDVSLTAELKGFNHARNSLNGNKVSDGLDEIYLSPGVLWKYNPRLQFSGGILFGLSSDSSDVGFFLEAHF